jgi:hypothetical protein
MFSPVSTSYFGSSCLKYTHFLYISCMKYIVACILVMRQVISGFRIKRAIYLTFTRRSYKYLLHNLAPLKLNTLASLSPILTPEFFLVIPSPVVFSLSAVSQYLSPADLSSFCPVS